MSGLFAQRGLEVMVIVVFDDGCNGFICFLHVKSSKFKVFSPKRQASPHAKLPKTASKLAFFSLEKKYRKAAVFFFNSSPYQFIKLQVKRNLQGE